MYLPELTTEQYNFCRAVDAMRSDMLRRGETPAWLLAHPDVLARTWGETPAEICGLRVMEVSDCPPNCFYLAPRIAIEPLERCDAVAMGTHRPGGSPTRRRQAEAQQIKT